MNNKQVYKITYTDSFDWHVYVLATSEREASFFARTNLHRLEYDEEEMSRSGPFIEPVERDDSDYERCNEYIDYCEGQEKIGLTCLPHLKWLAEQD